MASFLEQTATPEQIAHCKHLLDGHTVANRGRFDGNALQQLFGFIAETIVADLVGCERPAKCHEGRDQGYDVTINGVRLDVKCVFRDYAPRMNWACNLTADQAMYNCDAYLFVSYNRSDGVFSIMGWIPKKEFLEQAKLNTIGSVVTRDNGTTFTVKETAFYEMPIFKLRRITSAQELRSIGVQ